MDGDLEREGRSMIICPVKRSKVKGLGQVDDERRWESHCSTIERKQKSSYLVKRFMDAFLS